MHLHKLRIVAYQLGKNIQIENFKKHYRGSIHSSTATEIFIKKSHYSFICIQHQGEVTFSDCDETTITKFIEFVIRFVTTPVLPDKEYKEDFIIDIDPDHSLSFDYTAIRLPMVNDDIIKIVMLNVSQSVVLDYFTALTQDLLYETTNFTQELELRGKLNVSRIKLMKFIGRILNTQNRIIDNLYFHDAPNTVWNDEYLSQLNEGLSKTFELKTRFRDVEYTLKIINNNLSTFSQLVQHRESNKLEWIIIVLILFEILNMLVDKFH